jgi:hypothetical protein
MHVRVERETAASNRQVPRRTVGGSSPAEHVLALQRSAGNAAVQHLLRSDGAPLTGARLQRAMKFELQTRNPVWRTRGKKREKLPRKFGPKQKFGKKWEDVPLHKGKEGDPPTRTKEGSAVELQSETGGVVEFETPEWFSDWCELKRRMQEAVDMVDAISKAKKVGKTPDGHDLVEFPFDVRHLRKSRGFSKGLKPDEKLVVEIADPTWVAAIQSSESIELSQFESFLKEHERASWATEAITKADEIVKDANTKGIADADLVNLRNFLQIIIDYILNAQFWEYDEPHAAKEYLSLMARTSFSSIYRELLSTKEKDLFDEIVKSGAIVKKMGLTKKSLFYAHGVRGPLKSLKVSDWLPSISKKGRLKAGKDESRKEKDLLSRPVGGSAAMGKFDVQTKPGKESSMLVRLETRETKQGRVRKVGEWVSYAEKLFKEAFTARGRKGKSTALKYDPAACKPAQKAAKPGGP